MCVCEAAGWWWLSNIMKLDSLLLCVAIQSATGAGAEAPETSSDGSKAISFLFLIPNAASAAIATLLLLLSLLLSYQGSQTPPNGVLLLRSNDEELWSPGQTARLNGCDIYVQGCSHRSYWRGLHPCIHPLSWRHCLDLSGWRKVAAASTCRAFSYCIQSSRIYYWWLARGKS